MLICPKVLFPTISSIIKAILAICFFISTVLFISHKVLVESYVKFIFSFSITPSFF
jgi:hypothetical protein